MDLTFIVSHVHVIPRMYTHDQQDGIQDGQFYFVENQDFRRLATVSPATRNELLEYWAPHVKWFLSALDRLPAREMEIYRGRPVSPEEISKIYYPGRKITFLAITSASFTMEAAINIAGRGRTVLRIKAYDAKEIAEFSFYREEREVVLAPNSAFLVTSDCQAMWTGGWNEVSVIDLHQIRGKALIS